METDPDNFEAMAAALDEVADKAVAPPAVIDPDPNESILKGFAPSAFMLNRPVSPRWKTDPRYAAWRRASTRERGKLKVVLHPDSIGVENGPQRLASTASLSSDIESQALPTIGPIADLKTFFGAVKVISLTRTPQRLQAFWQRFPTDWPFATPEVFQAIDGQLEHPRPGWRANKGAWGCYRSWETLLDQFIAQKIDKPVLVMEDDAQFVEGATARFRHFLERLPERWQIAFFGCQHMRGYSQVRPGIVRVNGAERTHCLAINPSFFKEVRRQWEQYNGHVDHCLRDIAPTHYFYAASPVLAVQMASRSYIMGGRHDPTRPWDDKIEVIDDKAYLKFHHSGKYGDLIYGLPAMRAMGGGILYLSNWPHTGMQMTPAAVALIAPLLKAQPYIQDVKFSPVMLNDNQAVNLNKFRENWRKGINIADFHLSAFDLPHSERERPWLAVDPIQKAKVIIQRSPRYHNVAFPWGKVLEKYVGDILFVGLSAEHQDFQNKFGTVPFYQAKDYLELAGIIAGSELFVGNQSGPLAVAIGLGVKTLQEIWKNDANCRFVRPNVLEGWNENINLPDTI